MGRLFINRTTLNKGGHPGLRSRGPTGSALPEIFVADEVGVSENEGYLGQGSFKGSCRGSTGFRV